MLLENFYKIIHIKEREDGKQAIEIELNPGHVLYQCEDRRTDRSDGYFWYG